MSMFEILEPGGQFWANSSSMVSRFQRIRVPKFYSKVNVFAVCANNDLEMHY